MGEEVEDGSFTIRQNGLVVASGRGPLEFVREEAVHYAAVYAQDGPVIMRVRRIPKRKTKSEPTPADGGG